MKEKDPLEGSKGHYLFFSFLSFFSHSRSTVKIKLSCLNGDSGAVQNQFVEPLVFLSLVISKLKFVKPQILKQNYRRVVELN